MLPRVLKNFNLFIDGQGYAGRVSDISLPRLALRTEEFRLGGLDTPVQVDMGMEKLECEITLSEYDEFVIKRFGMRDLSPLPIQFRGAGLDSLFNPGVSTLPFTLRGGLQAEAAGNVAERVLPVLISLEGHMVELNMGQWVSGQITPLKMRLALRYYRLQLDEQVLVEIDVENRRRRINGTNQLTG